MRERPRAEPTASAPQRRRGARVLAWSIWAVTVTAYLLAVTVLGAQWALLYLPGFLVLFTVGLPIALRQPRNPIGWILQGCAAAESFLILADSYVHEASAPGSVLPGAALAAVWRSSLFALSVAPQVTFVLLLFPTGRLPSRRWRPVAWAAGLGLAVTTLAWLLQPGPIDGYPADNPLGVEAASEVLPAAGTLGLGLLGASTVASAGSLWFRWRPATNVERQQLKWLLLAGALLVIGNFLIIAVSPFITEDDPENLAWRAVDISGTVLPLILVPGAVAIAILRHRLYDIDLLINRTIIYGLLTSTLAVTYAAVVLPLGVAFGGSGDNSSLAVAGATLAVAAVFQPARRRIQALVDRRFDRRRYDAERTITAFSGRLRQQTDLDALTSELLSVVGQAMQPTRVALWLRPTAESGPAADSGRGGARVRG